MGRRKKHGQTHFKMSELKQWINKIKNKAK